MQSRLLRPRVGVGVYVVKDGMLLLGKRKGSHGAGEYETPGGHLEWMESFEECARREVHEELGEDVEIGNIRFIRVLNTRAYDPKHYVDIALLADWVSGEPRVMEPNKIERWDWYVLADRPTPLFEMVPSAFEALRTGQRFWDAEGTYVAPPRSGAFKIYFAASIRGGTDFALIKDRVEFLETIGEVTTRHMISPKNVDMGLSDDRAIYEHDQRLLAESHVFIADLSQPSTGAGFMADRAVTQGMPVLCLYREGQRPSAMLAGCPDVFVSYYRDEASFKECVRRFLLDRADALAGYTFRSRLVFLAGPPGSGKGTQAKRMVQETGMVHVSTGDLLRDIVRRKAHPSSETIVQCMEAGELVPADIMQSIVVERLRMPDCTMFGCILDGYPPSLADLANLRDHGFAPDIVFFLDCADATAENRQVKRDQRVTDVPEKAKKRLQVFHEAGADFDHVSKEWYPQEIVVRVDAEREPEVVWSFMHDTLMNLTGNPERTQSFFPIPPFCAHDVRSTRLHFHIDAKDVQTLRAIALEIYARCKTAQGQIKIYPIQSLELGPQTGRLARLYAEMPNFHGITNADSEAFITGRLGDGDTDLMRTVLEVALAHGGMVELEEYVYERTRRVDSTLEMDLAYQSLGVDMTVFAPFTSYSLAPEIPPYELHLGFNVAKATHPEMPISLAELIAACAVVGMENGGWFIFKNERYWAYRSNEFSFDDVQLIEGRLRGQAHALQLILAAKDIIVDVSFSLEIVHGIWTAGRHSTL